MATKKTTAKTRTPRATRSRAQLNQDFDDVRGEVEDLEEQDTTATTAARQRASVVKAATQGLTPEAAAEAIMKAKLTASRALDSVAEELLQKTEQLKDVREAIDLETKELEELHGKEIIASSTRALVEDYKAREEELRAQMEERQQDFARRVQEYEKQFAEQRTEQLKKVQREDADYQYGLQQKRKLQIDGFAEEDRKQRLMNEDKQRLLELGWKQREETIAAQEQEFAEFRTRVAAFPEELKKEVDAKVAIATNSVKKDFSHQIAMLEAQQAASVKVLEGEKKALADSNAALARQVVELTTQLSATNAHLQKISSDALSSASGQAALVALQQQQANGGAAPGKPARS